MVEGACVLMPWPLAAYFAFVLFLVTAVLLVSYLLGPRHSEPATGQPFEGGIVQEGSAHVRFLVRCRGLFWRRPVIASVFIAVLLSLAGNPTTMGFVGKFYVLAAGANAGASPLIVILAILAVASAAGLFYYLPIVVALLSAAPENAPIRMVARDGAFVLVVLAILLIWFGVYPTPLLNLIQTTMRIWSRCAESRCWVLLPSWD